MSIEIADKNLERNCFNCYQRMKYVTRFSMKSKRWVSWFECPHCGATESTDGEKRTVLRNGEIVVLQRKRYF